MTGQSGRNSDGPVVCVIGSGTHFISGISYYTYYLSDVLSQRYRVSVILMRRLIPKRFYPGRDRVGAPITELDASTVAPTFDGVDWYAIPSLFRAGRFLKEQDPDTVIVQWWTGAVLLSYLFLTGIARRGGARIVIEFHEDQDTGETSLPLVRKLVGPGLGRLIRRADHYVVHSEWDKVRLVEKFGLDPDRVSVIAHGPYPLAAGNVSPGGSSTLMSGVGALGTEVVTILFFGTVRPYKGLEDLVDAFELLPRDDTLHWKLLAVGETWEGWTIPSEKMMASPYSGDIEFVNRYVTDSELPHFFDRADVVALPYRRSSASGPLHMTMQRGLPVVVTKVGGLTEVVSDYTGAVLVEGCNPVSLAEGIVSSLALRGLPHADQHTWAATLCAFEKIIHSFSDPERDDMALPVMSD